MLGIRYYKADASTYVLRTVGSAVKQQGRGLSFFYNTRTNSIAAIPVNSQDVPFIFNLQTGDYQEIVVQGQITYQITDPLRAAEALNFTIGNGRVHSYVSEDPVRLPERVVRTAQGVVQDRIEGRTLKQALGLSNQLTVAIREGLAAHRVTTALGLEVLDVSVMKIAPTPETARALEAQTREAILQDADDATYARRKSAVEQERTIREAELDTDQSVQEKEQAIEARRIENEREIFRSRLQTQKEQLQAEIEAEGERRALVDTRVANRNKEAEADAFAVRVKMGALQTLPVEHLKAMALAQMEPDQLMAMAMESFAQNAHKIGELNISPDLVSGLKRAVRQRVPQPKE